MIRHFHRAMKTKNLGPKAQTAITADLRTAIQGLAQAREAEPTLAPVEANLARNTSSTMSPFPSLPNEFNTTVPMAR